MRRALAAALLLGCGAAPPPVAEPDPANVEVSIEHGALPDVVRMLNRISGEPVVLGARVDRAAPCITMSLAATGRVTASRAVELIALALEDTGAELRRVDGAIVIRASADAPLPRCDEPLATRMASCPEVRPEPPARSPASPVELTGVRRVSDTEVAIERATLNRLFEDPAAIQVRVIPHEENGRVVGLRLYGIRRSSALATLGFLNGDLVRRVNGHEVNDPASALEVYAQIRNADRIEIEIERRGQPVTIVLRVVAALPE